MSRAPGMTVADLWEEWTIGLRGGPAIRDLEREGTTWRRSPSESRFFQRRKIVLDEVQRLVDGGRGAVEAVAEVVAGHVGKELNAISEALKRRRGEQVER